MNKLRDHYSNFHTSILIEAREHFEIYDFEGEGKIDAKDLGDLLRSLDCKPTLATVKKNGGTEKKGLLLLI